MPNSIRKGKRGEREAAALIRQHLGTDARRSVQHSGAHGDADLAADSIPGCHVEVKTVARIGALKYHAQATRDAKAGRVPLVMMRGDRTEWFVMLRADAFMGIFKENKCRDSYASRAAETGAMPATST